MNTMNFNYTFSKISLLTILFLSGFSNLGSTVVAEVKIDQAGTENILLSPKDEELAQNETVPTNTLEANIIQQINRARANPSDYADWLEEQRKYYDGIMLKLPGEKPVRTNRGLQALEEAIDFVRQQEPLSPLAYSEAMAIASQEQLTLITDDNAGNRRDSRFQNISYGKVTAEAIVMQLVVDDGFRDRRHRLAIFNRDNQETGVSCQEDQLYQRICAIAYAGTPEDLLVNEDDVPDLVIETNEVEPKLAIAPNETETTTQEAISIPEQPSVEENVIESEIQPETEAEDTTTSALNIQPNNSLLIDTIERGFLQEGDKVIPNDGSFYDSYPISVKAGESFVISLESTDFDTFLAIMDEEGNILEQNDDVNEDDSNSKLQITIPNDGTYRLIVNAYDPGGKGAYILTISR